MTREKKFRAWSNIQKKWLYFTLTDLLSEDTVELLTNWCEWTGLTDKLGKEIYEGDIIQEDIIYRIFKIEWDNSEARFDMVFCKGENGYEGQKRHIIDSFKMKIIGNIYENQDLLK